MATDRLTLTGCSPTPLASYLKALGVLRLLSSGANHVSGKAADSRVRGWWEDESFHLRTKLGREEVLDFFLHDYAPSPVIAPWNGGSGFYPDKKKAKEGFGPLSAHPVAERFGPFATAIQSATEILRQLGLPLLKPENETRAAAKVRRAAQKRKRDDVKSDLVAQIRARVPTSALPWVDAALVLSGNRPRFPQLLGTGGNDGNFDFTANFMHRLVSAAKPPGLFDASTGAPSHGAKALLVSALFDLPIHGLTGAKIGQFSPGMAGGPNATAGYRGESTVNSWDYVLMIEGTVTFACVATRRHQSRATANASFPFTVAASGAGWGGVQATDESGARGEFWAPLWHRPASVREIEAVFGEGRAVINGRTARDGLDFTRALAALGVSRGFSEFQRYGFFKRAGNSHYAAAMARRSAEPSLPCATLVADLDAGAWLNRVRRAGRAKNQPVAVRHTVKNLEDSLFEILGPNVSPKSFGRVLEAIGRVGNWLHVREVALAKARDKGSTERESVAPPPLLTSAWLRQANDGTREFRIAAALAALGIPESPSERPEESQERETADTQAPPMAAHLAPLTNGHQDGFEAKTYFRGRRLRKYRNWATDGRSPTAVWGRGELIANMIAVLERRLLEASIRGLTDKPLGAASFARMSDVAAFIAGEFDDARCSRLLAGLVWARPAWLPGQDSEHDCEPTVLPLAYSAFKPIFSTDEMLLAAGAIPAERTMPVPPGLVGLLRGGGSSSDGRAIDEAVHIAFARARASGLVSSFDSVPVAPFRGCRRIGAGVRPDRLAAAMLIPISARALQGLLLRAYPDPHRDNDNHPQEEDDVR